MVKNIKCDSDGIISVGDEFPVVRREGPLQYTQQMLNAMKTLEKGIGSKYDKNDIEWFFRKLANSTAPTLYDEKYCIKLFNKFIRTDEIDF